MKSSLSLCLEPDGSQIPQAHSLYVGRLWTRHIARTRSPIISLVNSQHTSASQLFASGCVLCNEHKAKATNYECCRQKNGRRGPEVLNKKSDCYCLEQALAATNRSIYVCYQARSCLDFYRRRLSVGSSVMNWKGCERKRSRSNLMCHPCKPWRTWGKPRKMRTLRSGNDVGTSAVDSIALDAYVLWSCLLLGCLCAPRPFLCWLWWLWALCWN